MSKAFVALLAWRFARLDFSSVFGFPHPIPHMSEWGDFLPVFKDEKEYNPAEHLKKFHECMDLLDLQHEDVCMKMFMHSLYGDAHQWYFSLPPSSISSLKDFHRVFNEHCKRLFSDQFLSGNCCEEYELNNKVEDANREESLLHIMHQFPNDLHDVISHQDELKMDNKRDEDSPINNISDFHKSKELISLVKNHENQLSIGHMSIKISEGSSQLSDLCIKESCSYDEKQDDIFPNLFQNPIVDNSMPKFSSMSFELFPDISIFEKYNEEEDIEFSRDLVMSKISFSSTIQHRDDQLSLGQMQIEINEDSVQFSDL
jgi:hypothetical protein